MRSDHLFLISFTFCLAAMFLGAGRVSGASFTPLGDLPGGANHSEALAVSADGSVVVGFSISGSGGEAFVWDATNGIQGLGDLAGGGFSSRAFGVSADGSIIVGVGESGSASQESFYWDATNGMQSLGFLPGGGWSIAHGTNADGSVVVGRSAGASTSPRAYVWDATNGMQDLGVLPPSTQLIATARGVSADGLAVVGVSTTTYNGVATEEAFIWDATNGMQGLGDLPGGNFGSNQGYWSLARAISPDGSTVIGISKSAEGYGQGVEAFIWDAANGMQGLSTVPGLWARDATGVTTSGSVAIVVGKILNLNHVGGAINEAFVWEDTIGLQPLRVVLTALGVDVTGWQLRDAFAVSADGTTIVGQGINPDGDPEAFVAVIPVPIPVPEPSGALPIGCLGLVCLRFRRRPFDSTTADTDS